MTRTRISTLAVALLLAVGASHGAPNLNINGLTIETGSGKTLGTLSSQGGMDEFTKLQKELVMTVIRQLGIDIESLPPSVRGQIEKPQTSNPQALQSFAKGLDLADKGQFKEAAAAFKEAARQDPGFALAAGMARLMPQVNLGNEGGKGELRTMRRVAREEGQRHGEQRLNRMNRPGNRMSDLGLSDGRGKKQDGTKMDPVDLVTDQDEGTKKNQGGNESRETVVVRNQDVNQVLDDVQRGKIDTSTPVDPIEGDYQGFAAGYFQDSRDGLFEFPIASASPTAVQIHFRPDEGQVDASLIIEGDMLSGSSGPVVSFAMVSQCLYHGSCGGQGEAYSYYVDKDTFWAYQLDFTDSDYYYNYDELVCNDYYYGDNNDFSYSSWGYWESSDYYGYYYNETNAFGYWVAGDLTPAAQIPNSGTAGYTGGMVGWTQAGYYIEGTMNWTVNFGSRTVGGTFDNVTKNGAAWLTNVNVSGGWNSGQNLVSANLTGTNVSSGVAKGAFFGPNAEELGGSWRIDHSNGDKAAGIFLGKPGGSRFTDYY